MNTQYKDFPGLLKLGEEGAETAQAVLKCVSYGKFDTKRGDIVYDKLVEEIGDVYASLMFVLEHAPKGFFKDVLERKNVKLKKFFEYKENKLEGWYKQ